MVHFHMRSQLWEHDYRLGVEYYQVLSMGLLMAPLPVVRIRCHDHCEVLAQRLVQRHCREILAPSLAHSLSSQRVVLDKRPPPLLILSSGLQDGLLNPHFNQGSCVEEERGSRQSPRIRGWFPSPQGSWPLWRLAQAKPQAGGQGEGTERCPEGSGQPGPHSGLQPGQLCSWPCLSHLARKKTCPAR